MGGRKGADLAVSVVRRLGRDAAAALGDALLAQGALTGGEQLLGSHASKRAMASFTPGWAWSARSAAASTDSLSSSETSNGLRSSGLSQTPRSAAPG